MGHVNREKLDQITTWINNYSVIGNMKETYNTVKAIDPSCNYSKLSLVYSAKPGTSIDSRSDILVDIYKRLNLDTN